MASVGLRLLGPTGQKKGIPFLWSDFHGITKSLAFNYLFVLLKAWTGAHFLNEGPMLKRGPTGLLTGRPTAQSNTEHGYRTKISKLTAACNFFLSILTMNWMVVVLFLNFSRAINCLNIKFVENKFYTI